MEKTWLKIKNWIAKNKTEFIILVFILLIAAVCRLYRIDQYMTFLGDEGRDVLIVRRIFTEAHPPLIGPGTSVGQMYLGPLYYYMMAPALLLAGFSPIGPAVQIALLGVATVGLVWWIGRKWFGSKAGLIASALYAISPTIIVFSRSSWNPNIMPFFALLSVYSIWKVWEERKLNWLIILGITFAFVLQSHYLGLLLLPTLMLFRLLAVKNYVSSGKWESAKRQFFKKSLIGLVIFLVLMSPLLFFDLRHNFQNLKAFEVLFAAHGDTVSLNLNRALQNILVILNSVNATLLGTKNLIIGTSLTLLGALIIGTNLIKEKLSKPYILLVAWIGFGVIGFAFYKLPIYDHYMGFLFPAPFILFGGVIADTSKLFKNKVLASLVLVIPTLFLVAINLNKNPFRDTPNRQLQRSQEVARKILSEDGDKPFDLAVLAERNYEDGYRYFLELWGGKVLHADIWHPETIGDQLFVVCEMEEKKCDPTHSPKAEVANFGMSIIDDKWEVSGVIIYKLSHTK